MILDIFLQGFEVRSVSIDLEGDVVIAASQQFFGRVTDLLHLIGLPDGAAIDKIEFVHVPSQIKLHALQFLVLLRDVTAHIDVEDFAKVDPVRILLLAQILLSAFHGEDQRVRPQIGLLFQPIQVLDQRIPLADIGVLDNTERPQIDRVHNERHLSKGPSHEGILVAAGRNNDVRPLDPGPDLGETDAIRHHILDPLDAVSLIAGRLDIEIADAVDDCIISADLLNHINIRVVHRAGCDNRHAMASLHQFFAPVVIAEHCIIGRLLGRMA